LFLIGNLMDYFPDSKDFVPVFDLKINFEEPSAVNFRFFYSDFIGYYDKRSRITDNKNISINQYETKRNKPAYPGVSYFF
jgi:hypothetical protein